MTPADHASSVADTGAALIAKAVPPVSVSLATVAGYQVSDILVWVTLIYTAILLGHKLWQIWRDIRADKP